MRDGALVRRGWSGYRVECEMGMPVRRGQSSGHHVLGVPSGVPVRPSCALQGAGQARPVRLGVWGVVPVRRGQSGEASQAVMCIVRISYHCS